MVYKLSVGTTSLFLNLIYNVDNDYIATLGEEIIITLAAGYDKYVIGGKALAENGITYVIDLNENKKMLTFERMAKL